ncbi:hypothetical protein C8J56DRAFT_1052910 [Mycena floridula]|nr:hypothetical protein C8J56DRAFT_1052910 [Mycena floridula]
MVHGASFDAGAGESTNLVGFGSWLEQQLGRLVGILAAPIYLIASLGLLSPHLPPPSKRPDELVQPNRHRPSSPRRRAPIRARSYILIIRSKRCGRTSLGSFGSTVKEMGGYWDARWLRRRWRLLLQRRLFRRRPGTREEQEKKETKERKSTSADSDKVNSSSEADDESGTGTRQQKGRRHTPTISSCTTPTQVKNSILMPPWNCWIRRCLGMDSIGETMLRGMHVEQPDMGVTAE